MSFKALTWTTGCDVEASYGSRKIINIKAEPLRSEEHPLGLPSLQGLDRTRTQAANHLYAFTLLCIVTNVSVENPSSSYLWLVTYRFCQQNQMLMDVWLALEQVHFQACMHGSDRDKWTCWYSTTGVFTPIRARCDGNHQHKSWKPTLDSKGNPVFPRQVRQHTPSNSVRPWLVQWYLSVPPEGFPLEQRLFNLHCMLKIKPFRPGGVTKRYPHWLLNNWQSTPQLWLQIAWSNSLWCEE